MRGSFSIEASFLVPVIIMVMLFSIKGGIGLYMQVKEQVKELSQPEEPDIVGVLYGIDKITDIGEMFHGN